MLVGGTVYVAVAMAGIAIADGTKTMSDNTYHHQVYSGVIHGASDASYIPVTMLFWLLWIAVASLSLFLASRPAGAERREPSAATS